MKLPDSFLWHDYETFGTHPARDRPAQFAALRTNVNLEPVGEPLNLFCAPADDCLPHPQACLVTGISPQRAAAGGVIEAEFARRLHDEMMEPGTCSVGYNSLRFDDEFSRFLFYRNFIDPYEREWRNGNSRFDLIDLVRMFYALRPTGIEWPQREDGKPSFRLEDLTAANGIGHEGAHDALADVRATIDLARLLKASNARLFDYALQLRDKDAVLALLNVDHQRPLLHTSSRFPAERGCTTLVLPLARVPGRPKSVIVVDLMTAPDDLISLDADDIADRVFTPTADLPDGVERIPLKAVHANKVPMLAEEKVLKGVDLARIGLDPARCHRHASQLAAQGPALRQKLERVFQRDYGPPEPDPDTQLYAGGFFSPRDRQLMNRVRTLTPAELSKAHLPFEDPRLPTMLFRYRARNFPDSLTAEEQDRWREDRDLRLVAGVDDGRFRRDAFDAELALARQEQAGNTAAQGLLDELEAWVRDLGIGSS